MRAVFILALALLGVGAAVAQDAYLDAQEARRVFHGIDMHGTHEPSGTAWRECITPEGRTSYWFRGAVDEGRLAIRGDGALCFSYASSNFSRASCWKAKRLSASTYRFESADGDDGVFVTKSTRPTRACAGPETPMS